MLQPKSRLRHHQQFQELSMQRIFMMEMRTADPPTWRQMKRLTQEDEKPLQKANQPLNPVNLLLAMLAVINCQVSSVSAHSFAYWAYVPNPPLVQSVSWGEPEVSICTNTNFFPPPECGGIEDIPFHENLYNISNITIAVEGVPLCIGAHSFCLPVIAHNDSHSYNTWGINYQNYSTAVFTVMISSQEFNVSNMYVIQSLLMSVECFVRTHLPLCSAKYFKALLTHLEWEKCHDHHPKMVVKNQNITIVDWSTDHSEFIESWSNRTLRWHRHNGTINAWGNETIKMQHYALVPPMLQHIKFSNVQGDIWKLWTVSGKLTVWTRNFMLNVSHSSPFEVHLHNNLILHPHV
ncbi:endogenous retrovirus group K member 25 Env polyprotein-like [Marmota marmota marmota]|uniref:endogenous retrovirus group K member 25 Env polyprotein-like n=1 Tax=Marmota marmota marmota TaxID=9994 RepID=UPI002093298B|nr:endogenous retrovirus group K member 25 Env polyprotein-like [Marmota marmota marmota]